MPGRPRPARLVVVAGTGTEVGKTWVACELARRLRGRGLKVNARKLAQSFAPEDGPTDAARLAEATGEKAAAVCPPARWYPKAMAPPMAAESLGLPSFSLADLLGELRWPPALDVGLVECAGGVGSPQADFADGVDLVERLLPEWVVLVAGPGLGTLNDVRLAARALSGHPLLVYLNHYDGDEELHVRNRRWLAERDGLFVAVTPAGLAEAVQGR
jgi:dethiobiotin synthetase